MIQDQSESNSERGKDKNFYLSEEAGLTPLLAMTQSFEDCDWLVVQEGSKSAFKSRVYYKQCCQIGWVAAQLGFF